MSKCNIVGNHVSRLKWVCNKVCYYTFLKEKIKSDNPTVLPAKSDSEVMFCLQSYQGVIIDRSLMY